jgi:hypothetical protein
MIKEIEMRNLLLLSFFSIGILYSQVTNPCEDERYQQIKDKSLDDMSDREYAYFTKMDDECKKYQQSNSFGKVEIQNQLPTTKKNESIYNFSELSDDQLKEYNNRKVSIEVVKKGLGSFNTNIGVAAGESWRKWTAYKGFDKISEQEFFSLTGYEEQALKAKGFGSRNINFIWGGLAGCILGILRLGTAVTMLEDDVYNAEADAVALQGIVVASIGAGAIVYGFIELEKNWAPYATVEGITKEYNDKLMKELTN